MSKNVDELRKQITEMAEQYESAPSAAILVMWAFFGDMSDSQQDTIYEFSEGLNDSIRDFFIARADERQLMSMLKDLKESAAEQELLD